MIFRMATSFMFIICVSKSEENYDYALSSTEFDWNVYASKNFWYDRTTTPSYITAEYNKYAKNDKTEQNPLQFAPLDNNAVIPINGLERYVSGINHNLQVAEADKKHLEPKLMSENNYATSHKNNYRSFIFGHNIHMMQTNKNSPLKPTQMIYRSTSPEINIYKNKNMPKDEDFENEDVINRPMKSFFNYNRMQKNRFENDRYQLRITNEDDLPMPSKYASPLPPSGTAKTDSPYKVLPPVSVRVHPILASPLVLPPPPPALLPLSPSVPPSEPAPQIPVIQPNVLSANDFDTDGSRPKYELVNFGSNMFPRYNGNAKPPRLHLNIRRIYSAGHMGHNIPLLQEEPALQKIAPHVQAVYPVVVQSNITPFKTLLYPVQELQRIKGIIENTTIRYA